MKYSEIKCINENWLDMKIEELELKYHNTPRTKHSAKSDSLLRRIELLEEIKQHLTSATPILEKVKDLGMKRTDFLEELQQDFEKFLNTDIKI